jgi:outer membrane protein OmpA-like peptidoglycan-associated protein
MTKFKRKYNEIAKIKGDFFSDFVTKEITKTNGSKILTIELVGRKLFSNAQIINSYPNDLSSNKSSLIDKNELEDVEIYPLKSQKSPIESEKRITLNNFIIEEPIINDSFLDSGVKKGQISGIAYASVGEWIEVPLKEDKSASKKPYNNINSKIEDDSKTINDPNLDTSHLIKPVDAKRKGCWPLNRKQKSNILKKTTDGLDSSTNTTNDSNLAGSQQNNKSLTNGGCLGSGCGGSGCNTGAGCNNLVPGGCGSFGSGCQRIGCGLLSLLLLLGLLLGLLKQCNNNSSNNEDRAYDDVRVDTVRVYEIDTVEKVILDTLYSIDTVKLTDTMYTVIKNALPLPNVLFKSNSAIIRSSSIQGIKSLGDSLSIHEEINMIIAGHTDASGDDKHNDTLSFCRAKSVKDVLVDSCGISSERLIFEGYGENCPIEDNKSMEGKTTNRRVEFRYFGESSGVCEEFKIQINDSKVS